VVFVAAASLRSLTGGKKSIVFIAFGDFCLAIRGILWLFPRYEARQCEDRHVG
jgi:hypothetical protein